jgi:hypothetical protein
LFVGAEDLRVAGESSEAFADGEEISVDFEPQLQRKREEVRASGELWLLGAACRHCSGCFGHCRLLFNIVRWKIEGSMG